MITKIFGVAVQIASKYGTYVKRTVDIDYKLLRTVGWKPGALILLSGGGGSLRS